MLRVLVGITLCVGLVVAFLLSTTKADPLPLGASAPSVAAVDENGKAVNLEEIFKKGITLVYFYPKADTPGCTKEACAIRDKWEDVQKLGVTVIGVSMDKPEAQKAFKEKYKLPFTLLADADGAVVKAFGVSTKRIGFANRQSYLIKDGKIAWFDPNVSAETHLDIVMKAVASLGTTPAPAKK
ncbi:MAG TPA: peroxiredoxin [Verrucomicrobiales bacterium]|jgi:peroxiredoxin Q/BCP|nr:peroxiredoxin [Verrucomicrobiales bacterium]